MPGLVVILRRLWRHRVLVMVGAWLGLAVSAVTAFSVKLDWPPELESRKYTVGVATAAVLVDSPTSQTVDLGGTKGSADVASLSSRARLLANLMTTSPLKDQIARRAGVRPQDLVGRVPVTTGPPAEPTPLDRKVDDRRAYLLNVHVNETLPILNADAQAPTPGQAARISSAAVAELSSYLSSTAAANAVPDARQLRAEALGPARAAWTTRGPRRLFAVAANIFVFVLWCGAILLISGLARSWREAAALEERRGDVRPDAAAGSEPFDFEAVADDRSSLVLIEPEPPGSSGRTTSVGPLRRNG